MKIVHLADQESSDKVDKISLRITGRNAPQDSVKACTISTSFLQLKEEFKSILERIEENVDLK